MPRQTSFQLWFRDNFRIPEKNVSLYMRKMLKSAYKAGTEDSGEIRKAYKAGYDKGYRAGRK